MDTVAGIATRTEAGVKAEDQPPRSVLGQHLPALDGVRAIAIIGVMAYHLGFGWASGGYLGVDLFFVLSGFLITSLLLEERGASDRVRLGAFWGRRARRLLPALFLVLAAVSLYAVVNGRFTSPGAGGAAIDLSGLRGDALATLFYVANWHAIFSHQSYFAQFSTPSPLQHTWSLAIEEQFYLLWPLVIVGLFRWVPARWRRAGFGLCVIGAVASMTAMALLYHPGGDPSRIYYGTDTRAFDLLAGAAVAFLSAGRAQPGRRVRSWLHVVSPLSAATLAVFWVVAGTTTGMPTSFMFLGGFLICALLAAVVIADVRQFDRGLLANLLSVRPLRWIGTISYGLYLWHWPIFVYLDQARTGLSGAALDTLRVALTFAVASASYYLLELPIRRRRFLSMPARLVLPGAVAATALVVLIGTTPSIAEPSLAASPKTQVGGLDPATGTGAVVGAGGFEQEVPIALPPGAVVSKAHPLNVVVFGDSIMTLAQNGLQAALRSTHEATVVPAAVPGWTVSSSDMARLMRVVRQYHPQILIGTWSWDAPAARADPSGYQASLDAALRTMLAAPGVSGVILLQMPALGPVPSYLSASSATGRGMIERAEGVPAWNAAVSQAATEFPGKVMYLPVANSLEIDGRYTNWLPPHNRLSAPRRHWVRVRTIDGVHLCPAGITRYAAPVLQDLRKIFDLAPSGNPWWHDREITSNFYESAHSLALSCPNDHPPKTLEAAA